MSILNSSHSDTNRLYHDTTTTQQEHRSVQRKVCFIINAFLALLIKHFEKTLQEDIDIKVFKINFTETLQENIYFQDHFSRRNPFPKIHLQTTMSKRTSQANMKGKGKAPAVQPKPKQSRKPYVRISDRHEGVSIETISLLIRC